MNDQTYEIAGNWIDSAISEFDNNPVEYIKSMGWSVDMYPKINLLINEISATREDIENLKKIIEDGIEDGQSMLAIAEGNPMSDFLTNLIAGKISDLYKTL